MSASIKNTGGGSEPSLTTTLVLYWNPAGKNSQSYSTSGTFTGKGKASFYTWCPNACYVSATINGQSITVTGTNRGQLVGVDVTAGSTYSLYWQSTDGSTKGSQCWLAATYINE